MMTKNDIDDTSKQPGSVWPYYFSWVSWPRGSAPKSVSTTPKYCGWRRPVLKGKPWHHGTVLPSLAITVWDLGKGLIHAHPFRPLQCGRLTWSRSRHQHCRWRCKLPHSVPTMAMDSHGKYGCRPCLKCHWNIAAPSKDSQIPWNQNYSKLPMRERLLGNIDSTQHAPHPLPPRKKGSIYITAHALQHAHGKETFLHWNRLKSTHCKHHQPAQQLLELQKQPSTMLEL